ncbi:Putative spermidine/putrescine transport system permease protein [Hyphomicrobiales bacterium]|nr:Putative spermidine/putrescine transport system permease protein [Hyphomicrobiales bacterium]CAH1675325.1 putative spermidine/putrescine transport system permease protein [Hyphomicrobiales bacterium]
MQKTLLGSGLWYVGAALFFGFLLAPLAILIAVSFNPVAMVFPPQGFTLKWYATILDKPDFLHAALASTILGVATALFSTGLGVLAAIGLQRQRGAARAFVSSLLMSPLFIPAVIVALALFQIIFMLGLVNNVWTLLAAHVVVTLPYPLRNVMAQMEGFDVRLEEAALSVGATPRQALWRVTLPLLKASIIPSLIIVFVLSWNNYTVSVFLANKNWTTLPLQLRAYLQYEYEPFVAAMSTVLIVASVILLVIVDRTVGLGAVRKRD